MDTKYGNGKTETSIKTSSDARTSPTGQDRPKMSAASYSSNTMNSSPTPSSSNGLSSIKRAGDAAANSVKEAVSSAKETVNSAKDTVNSAKDAMGNAKVAAKEVVNTTKDAVNTAKDSVTSAGQAGFAEIKADLKAIVADFESLSAHTGETIESTKTALAEGLKVVGDKIESLGNKMNFSRIANIGKAIEKLGDKVEHFNDPRKS
ncbi:MAG: hypothetical protein ABIQ95_13345 [Bdellovibrionia bacterium]